MKKRSLKALTLFLAVVLLFAIMIFICSCGINYSCQPDSITVYPESGTPDLHTIESNINETANAYIETTDTKKEDSFCIATELEIVFYTRTGCAIVRDKKSDLFYMIDRDGKRIHNNEYQKIDIFNDNIIIAVANGDYTLFDHSGIRLNEMSYRQVNRDVFGNIVVITKEGEYNFLSEDGKNLLFEECFNNVRVEPWEDPSVCIVEDKTGAKRFYMEGEIETSYTVEMVSDRRDIFLIHSNDAPDKFGVVSCKNGKITVIYQPIADEISVFNYEYENLTSGEISASGYIVAARLNGKYALISPHYKTDYVYDNIYVCDNGRLVGEHGDKAYYLDVTKVYYNNYIFTEEEAVNVAIKDFENGFSLIKYPHKSLQCTFGLGVADKDGNILIPTLYDSIEFNGGVFIATRAGDNEADTVTYIFDLNGTQITQN